MSTTDSRVVRALLEPLLLASLETAPKHGYGLHKALEDLGAEITRNKVYALLTKFEEDGLVARVDVEDDGPGQPRTIYGLTDAGRALLDQYRRLSPDLADALAALWRDVTPAPEAPAETGTPSPRAAEPPARATLAGPGGKDLPYPCPSANLATERDLRTGDVVLRLTGCPMGAYDYCPQCPVYKKLQGLGQLLLG